MGTYSTTLFCQFHRSGFRASAWISLYTGSRPDAQEKLPAKRALLEEAARTPKTIRADNLQYHHEFFTTAGTRSGWSAFVDHVSVE